MYACLNLSDVDIAVRKEACVNGVVLLTMINHAKRRIVVMGQRGYQHVGLIGIVR